VNVTGTAGVIARPPLLFLTALVLGFVSEYVIADEDRSAGDDPADQVGFRNGERQRWRSQLRKSATSPDRPAVSMLPRWPLRLDYRD
jgi:hypothetical protein